MCSVPCPPAVSVIMPVYNGATYLEEAVRSILNQTFTDFEFIIVDDCSTDETPEILKKIAAEDDRIRLLRAETNGGGAAARNIGLRSARAPIVAAMDADDVAYPNRLEVQVSALDADPELALVGSSIRRVTPDGQKIRFEIRDHDPDDMAFIIPLRSPIPHPTAVFRRLGPEGEPFFYDTTRDLAEDFDIFARIAATGKVLALPDVLLDYRVHPLSQMATKRAKLVEVGHQVMTDAQARFLPASLADSMTPYKLASGHQRVDPVELTDVMTRYATHFATLVPRKRTRFHQLAGMEVHRFLSKWEKSQVKGLLHLAKLRPSWALLVIGGKLQSFRSKLSARLHALRSDS